MIKETRKELNKIVSDFYKWVEDLVIFDGPSYRKSIVTFKYGEPRRVYDDSSLSFERRMQLSDLFNKGKTLGSIRTQAKSYDIGASIEINDELLNKIDEVKEEIQVRYREEVMPALQKREILELQSDLEQDSKWNAEAKEVGLAYQHPFSL